MMILLASTIGAAIMSWLICAVVKTHAQKWRLVDVPNTRSSHVAPTPRGGGLGIVAALYTAVLVLVVTGEIDIASAVVLLPALPIALLGFVDDRKSLGVRLRLFVQLTCAGAIVLLTARDFSGGLMGWVVAIAMLVYVAWLINLYNFMDGIDGIAATQTITVLAGAVMISCWQHGDIENHGWLVLLAACGGFLLWNWSPAKLFMGDVGSTFLGAVLAAWSLDTSSVPLASWLILMAAFMGDASYTLIRRALRREPVWQAHRSHLYQRLSRRWNSHTRVCWILMLVNLVWLLPLAVLAAHPGVSGTAAVQYAVVIVAYLPIVLVAYNMT
jgi:Fuc2NAc and GlcNAc transferase